MLHDAYLQWVRSRVENNRPRLSQAGLARALGVKRAQMTELWQGRRQIKLREIEAIEQYVGERWLTRREPPDAGGRASV